MIWFVYSFISRQICETQLLNKGREIPNSCDVRIIPGTFEIWHKLSQPNTWVYVLPKPTDITINCLDKKPINLFLNQTGILTLVSNCKLYTSSSILISESTVHESSFNSIIPEFDLLNDCCQKLNFSKNASTEQLLQFLPLSPVSLDSESLKIASHKLDDICKNLPF